jgi:hypothetical protein
MSKTLIGRASREADRASAPRHRTIAVVELITTAALALSTAIAATAVSIGIARADVVGTIAGGGGAPFAVALLIGVLLSAMAALSATAALGPRPGMSGK